MKHILTIILLAFFLAVFTVKSFDSSENVEMVTTLPELNSIKMQRDLEVDIGRLPGVKFVETSLSTRTLMLNYNSKRLSKKSIENTINKWGCTPVDPSFRSIASAN